MTEMLFLVKDLDIQPGDIPPTIHLKQGSNAMNITLRIAANDAVMLTDGTAILKATKPDGTEVFAVLPVSSIALDYIVVKIGADRVGVLTQVDGTYDATISIIDTEDTITQENYEEYDLITVQPFTLVVQKTA